MRSAPRERGCGRVATVCISVNRSPAAGDFYGSFPADRPPRKSYSSALRNGSFHHLYNGLVYGCVSRRVLPAGVRRSLT
jgi:hypothetical protein